MMGLAVVPGDAAERVLAAQLRSADHVALLRQAMNLFGLLFLWQVFGDHGSVPGLMVWSAALVLSMAVGAILRRRRNGAAASATDLRVHGFTGLLHGLVWAACMMTLSSGHGAAQLVAHWTLISCIMVCGAISYAATPLAATGFLLPCIVGLGALFDPRDQTPLLALATSYALSLLVGCFLYARTFARQHSASVQLEEKSEVVSLLLREYEHGASDWLWQTDPARRLSGVSPRLAEMLGRTPAEVEGVLLVQLLAGNAWESGLFPTELHALADHLKRRESFSNIVLPVELEGDVRWWELSASPRYDEGGAFLGFRGVGSDITEQKESAERIAQLARFDPLTGLPNRTHLRDVLDQAMGGGGTAGAGRGGCAFLMIDLDRFKAVNDTLGHQIGDKLLTQVARRLRHICSGAEFCGRIGGDEFAVVIPQLGDNHGVDRLAARIINGLSAPYQVDEHTLYVGASVGSAVSPQDGHESEALIRSADLALYRAKGDGGGVHCAYEPQLHAQAEERRQLELALRDALEKNQLHVLFQPVVEAQAGIVVGFEALVRWTHPDMGPISPAKFIPVAEEARLIGPIGEWVLRTACKEAACWPDGVRIGVNVSAEQLVHPSFVGAVVSALAQSGLEARRLELEVTESVFVNADTGALKILDQLRGLGVRLSLDDFGTGYSSLGYLSRTRFDTIKIDRSFVVGAANNRAESLAIIRAVVTLADSLGMATTAEGVETEAELAMVRGLGCRKVQGFYFGRPMPAADAAALFPGHQVRARA
ncbi:MULTISPECIES: putative bifunctional diguanylate cyclase/phosphodiesterase [Sphingobium]|uniref:GGDEF domain-containing protein n=1 Tax=Sphingobium fuliginis (strain ATCC 27551) TaxID=336203 RepID=A0ABQ1EL78_SPHSA|nr:MULTISPECIES: EAL domain-containing protein [Sphingobium]AJR22890.1 diguanylate cyclase [Sphingobium sp. YBL2]RYM01259.1 EAL domain-containing protein [Sphingobium fuliginis]WDA38874.1 EAL domain-containing protein [Sphingobium sp. YC-XJ3]GFZ76729.1 GGDEF domain-containing protein [Sphingobium fuliginis]